MKVLSVATAVFALILLMTIAASVPPAPVDPVASLEVFSSTRAAATLARVLPPVPHPTGSAANHLVRDRIADEMQSLGYRVEIQRQFVCGGRNVCADVENIIAQHERASARPVVLVSHYDSVPAGPGASDDGLGVATLLECARVLRDSHDPAPVAFLFTDGEELGLLGAQAFCERHPLARKLSAVINIEARGTSGRSLMFETSGGDGRFVRLMSSSMERPATSSLFYGVYEHLPNDTDLSVFKKSGIAGMNFASIGTPILYHTSLDDLTNLSQPTLQHHGDNVLAMARALAASGSAVQNHLVWFDFFSRTLIFWPEPFSYVLAFFALVIVIALLVLERKELRKIFTAALAILLAMVATAAVAVAAAFLLRASGAFPGQWVALPYAAVAFFWLLPVVIVLSMAVLFGHRLSGTELMIGAALIFTVIALATTFAFVSASFLFLVPALATGVASAIMRRSTRRWVQLAAVASCILVAVPVLIAPAWAFYDAMGLLLLPVVSLLVFLASSLCLPFVIAEGRRLHVVSSALFAIAAGVALIIAVLLPPYSRALPQHANLAYVQSDKRVFWRTDAKPLGGALQKAVSWQADATEKANVAAAARLPLKSPEVAVIPTAQSGSGREVTLRIGAARSAPVVTLAIHDRRSLQSMTIDGVPVHHLTRHQDDASEWTRLRLCTMQQHPSVDVRLRFSAVAPVDAVLEEISFGLPPSASQLVAARNAVPAVANNSGDVTVVRKSLRF